MQLRQEYVHTLWNEVFRQKRVAVPPADCLYKSHSTYIVTFSFTLQLRLEFCNTIVYVHWNYWRCERTNEKHWQLCQGSWSPRNSWVSAWNWTFIFGRLVPKTPLANHQHTLKTFTEKSWTYLRKIHTIKWTVCACACFLVHIVLACLRPSNANVSVVGTVEGSFFSWKNELTGE